MGKYNKAHLVYSVQATGRSILYDEITELGVKEEYLHYTSPTLVIPKGISRRRSSRTR